MNPVIKPVELNCIEFITSRPNLGYIHFFRQQQAFWIGHGNGLVISEIVIWAKPQNMLSNQNDLVADHGFYQNFFYHSSCQAGSPIKHTGGSVFIYSPKVIKLLPGGWLYHISFISLSMWFWSLEIWPNFINGMECVNFLQTKISLI